MHHFSKMWDTNFVVAHGMAALDECSIVPQLLKMQPSYQGKRCLKCTIIMEAWNMHLVVLDKRELCLSKLCIESPIPCHDGLLGKPWILFKLSLVHLDFNQELPWTWPVLGKFTQWECHSLKCCLGCNIFTPYIDLCAGKVVITSCKCCIMTMCMMCKCAL